MVSAGRGGQTCWRFLAALAADERVEIGGREHLARALRAASEHNITDVAVGDVAAECLRGTAEARRRFLLVNRPSGGR